MKPVVVAVMARVTPGESAANPGTVDTHSVAEAHDLKVSAIEKYASSASAALRISEFARAS